MIHNREISRGRGRQMTKHPNSKHAPTVSVVNQKDSVGKSFIVTNNRADDQQKLEGPQSEYVPFMLSITPEDKARVKAWAREDRVRMAAVIRRLIEQEAVMRDIAERDGITSAAVFKRMVERDERAWKRRKK
mgnify:CR=1 FL=1